MECSNLIHYSVVFVSDDDQEEVTISIEAKNDLSQGIRKMEEEKYSKTLPKKTRRRRENDNG